MSRGSGVRSLLLLAMVACGARATQDASQTSDAGAAAGPPQTPTLDSGVCTFSEPAVSICADAGTCPVIVEGELSCPGGLGGVVVGAPDESDIVVATDPPSLVTLTGTNASLQSAPFANGIVANPSGAIAVVGPASLPFQLATLSPQGWVTNTVPAPEGTWYPMGAAIDGSGAAYGLFSEGSTSGAAIENSTGSVILWSAPSCDDLVFDEGNHAHALCLVGSGLVDVVDGTTMNATAFDSLGSTSGATMVLLPDGGAVVALSTGAGTVRISVPTSPPTEVDVSVPGLALPNPQACAIGCACPPQPCIETETSAPDYAVARTNDGAVWLVVLWEQVTETMSNCFVSDLPGPEPCLGSAWGTVSDTSVGHLATYSVPLDGSPLSLRWQGQATPGSTSQLSAAGGDSIVAVFEDANGQIRYLQLAPSRL